MVETFNIRFIKVLVLVLTLAETFQRANLAPSPSLKRFRSEENDHYTTFPTPLEELERIYSFCRKKGLTGFSEAKINYRKCLVESELIKENESIEDVSTAIKCDNLEKRNKCWIYLASKINECIPERGTTVSLIYSLLSNTTCQDNDVLSHLISSNNVCSVQPALNDSLPCLDFTQMTSPDLCTSFNAQKECEESDLADCQQVEHKNLILKQLKTAQNILKCEKKSSKNFPSMSTKSPLLGDDYDEKIPVDTSQDGSSGTRLLTSLYIFSFSALIAFNT